MGQGPNGMVETGPWISMQFKNILLNVPQKNIILLSSLWHFNWESFQ